ncbi:hypothetical protein BCR43DRAFT_482833 [Syncephalastrum racemosum]|uniref:Uncharacterized protein n=1 Tax=Syncephalastrum racemosum TaxID=13706 RepID=A0A1X2HU76_SYNRA|nr:hypothetical protein BCR43DRAFT_482833 [Syncephalastrum racemosum]
MRLALLPIVLVTAYAGVFGTSKGALGLSTLEQRNRPNVRIGTTVLPVDMKGGKKRWLDYEGSPAHGKRRLSHDH